MPAHYPPSFQFSIDIPLAHPRPHLSSNLNLGQSTFIQSNTLVNFALRPAAFLWGAKDNSCQAQIFAYLGPASFHLTTNFNQSVPGLVEFHGLLTTLRSPGSYHTLPPFQGYMDRWLI